MRIKPIQPITTLGEQSQRQPMSYCTCGHRGDGGGPGTQHAGLIGHGHCLVEGCSCQKFTWARHIPGMAS